MITDFQLLSGSGSKPIYDIFYGLLPSYYTDYASW